MTKIYAKGSLTLDEVIVQKIHKARMDGKLSFDQREEQKIADVLRDGLLEKNDIDSAHLSHLLKHSRYQGHPLLDSEEIKELVEALDF